MQCFVIDCRHLLQERILQMLTNIEKEKKTLKLHGKWMRRATFFCTALLLMCDFLKPALLLLLHLVVLRPFLIAIEQ